MANLWSLNPNDWFDKNDKGAGVMKVADPYGPLREKYLDWLGGKVGQSGPKYTGELVAPMSQPEKQSFDFLRKYGESGYGQTFQAGQSEIQKTLGGYYNPATSPYYQAVKAEAKRNLEDTQKNIADISTSGAGTASRYFSGARIKNQSEAATDMGQALNTLLGQLSENERQNRLDVLPQALSYGTTEKQLPLQQATAYQALGALPRTIQQAMDTANYQDFLRTEQDYPLSIAGLAGQTQQSPLYQQNMPSTVYQLFNTLMNSAPQLLALLLGGGG